jgi:hypothetical protein
LTSKGEESSVIANGYGELSLGPPAPSSGILDTTLNVVEFIVFQPKGTSALDQYPVIENTLPDSGDSIVVHIASGTNGYWWAEGW